MKIPKILIAGQSSGVGKTTITLGIIAALHRRGLIVQTFKCGPDYIDPSYHTLASGRPCRNLDTWMLSPEQMVASFARACQTGDIAIIEGVMGLFDGSSYLEENGSSAHIAKLLDAPTLLVLDIGKMARSAGALALGYQQFDPELNLAGFLLNRAGSARHADGCTQAIWRTTGLPCFGWLGKESALHIPERHLGLIPTAERKEDEESQLEALIEKAADAVEESFDLDEILALAERGGRSVKAVSSPASQEIAHPMMGKARPRLAVARDEAFSFHYPDNLELLAEAGAELVFFSPLHDAQFPKDIDGLYLVGGFPELYARELSQNLEFLTGIRQLHQADRPIYAECGGLMALTEAVVNLDGKRWPMAGIVPGETHMQPRLASLGYRMATATCDNLLLAAGEQVRGHEFHYSRWVVDESALNGYHAWELRRRQSDSESRLGGYCRGNLLASYIHVHFGQKPVLAHHLFEKLSTNSHSIPDSKI